MNGTLNVFTKIISFADQQVNSNPRLKYVDWQRDITGVATSNPKSEARLVPPNSSLSIFNGIRTTTIDGTTAFSVDMSTLDPSMYRFTVTGGTAAGFRTGRGLTLSGFSVAFVVNTNATATVTTTGSFAAVQIGDEVFIPSLLTGDAANVLNPINCGYWLVLGKSSSTVITLVRRAGESFQATAETVTLTTNSQFRAYSTTGVQVGDHVDITTSFATATRSTFEIVSVTDVFFEVMSTVALPSESAITPNTGMTFYTDNKQFIYVESDQAVAVQVNGDTGTYQRISPADSSNPDQPGQYMRRGATWSLSVVNLSTSPANVLVIHCE